MTFATVAAMRRIEQLEQERGTSWYQMMTDAGLAAAQLIGDRFALPGKRVTVLCGPGNNGGDGLVVAAALHRAGALVTVALTSGAPVREPAATALADLPAGVGMVVLPCRSISSIFQTDLLIDAIYGIGFTGEVSEQDSSLFQLAAASSAVKIALDLPSGMDGDNGRYTDCLRADLTIAIACYKAAHLVSWARQVGGELLLATTSLTTAAENSELLLSTLSRELVCLPPRLPWSHKGQNGRLAVLSGSRRFPGAAVLACMGALRSGVGYVTLLATQQVCNVVAGHLPEVTFIVLPENEQGGIDGTAAEDIIDNIALADAVLAGCGMGDTDDTATIVRTLLEHCKKPLLLDADGINALRGDAAALGSTAGPVVLTPHPGEFSRLAKEHIYGTGGDYTLAAARLSAETDTTLLLKGAITGIFMGRRQPVFSFMGNDGLARGGSGDLLSGVIGSLMAQGASPGEATLCGAWLHGRSAELAAAESNRRWMTPHDLADSLCDALCELTEG
ncbi:MAG: NAD(P)H-hydrate dehydratase [Angelakisella sp.]